MDDMNAFENQVAREAALEAGPPRPVDVDSIVHSTTGATAASRWSIVTRWFAGGPRPGRRGGGITMMSAVKMVAAAAIVALFGGFLLVGVVGDPQDGELPPAAVSPAPPAELSEVQLPKEFSAAFECSTFWQDGKQENVVVGSMEGGKLVRRETRGELGRFDAEASDERLQGDWTAYTSTDEYFWPGVDPSLPLIFEPGVLRITAGEGSWQMPWSYFDLPGSVTTDAMDGVGYLIGAGAYDGLTAVFHLSPDNWDECHCFTPKGFTAESERCRFEMEGFIVEGVPPTPEVPE